MSPHAVITGAGSGIGRQVANRFAGLGYRLTLVDIDAASLASTAKACKEAGAEDVNTLAVDLATPTGPEEMLAESWATAPVDVLVNSAGIYPATPFLALDADTWDAVQNLNARAPLLATVALAQRAIEAGRHASVVNISSGAALRARPGAAPYSTSKAALEMATRASALELGQYGIRVNAVAPGFVTVNSSANPVTEEYAAAVSGNPLGRRGEPDDIARAVVWLAGAEADWITGETLRVDGGSSAGAMNLPLHWATNKATRREDNDLIGSHDG
ncbi:SDR family NAD(P)-dependent oxidoreductase [Arthrobacter sp. B1I2]|uniref:SDR family NAD(P)-dependent oxidoreductase n=1 Tax=Arthrobacter sp. B1I2 TaxID=3042263 RepID=UPI00278B3F2B|nr:SDR family oxidoreductase [Arthrobacter sp. B1I2]MDQ0730766.1 3-oxoacyl-[acyl-carrier protein] reductase [Arthrobacter sp. B1I2]